MLARQLVKSAGILPRTLIKDTFKVRRLLVDLQITCETLKVFATPKLIFAWMRGFRWPVPSGLQSISQHLFCFISLAALLPLHRLPRMQSVRTVARESDVRHRVENDGALR